MFELAWSASKTLLPIPENPSVRARNVGFATIPVSACGTAYFGWLSSPPLAPMPASIVDLIGLVRFFSALPLKRMSIVAASSAVCSAFTCRVVQYRGGA